MVYLLSGITFMILIQDLFNCAPGVLAVFDFGIYLVIYFGNVFSVDEIVGESTFIDFGSF